jgi:hypothetical protein
MKRRAVLMLLHLQNSPRLLWVVRSAAWGTAAFVTYKGMAHECRLIFTP